MTTRNIADHTTDHLAIRSLLDAYTDAVNRRDWDALEKLFAQDGVWDCGAPDMAGMSFRFEGGEWLREGYRRPRRADGAVRAK